MRLSPRLRVRSQPPTRSSASCAGPCETIRRNAVLETRLGEPVAQVADRCVILRGDRRLDEETQVRRVLLHCEVLARERECATRIAIDVQRELACLAQVGIRT